MTVDFKGRELELRYGFRPLMIYENIAGKTFNPSGLTDIVYLFYGTVGSERPQLQYSLYQREDDY